MSKDRRRTLIGLGLLALSLCLIVTGVSRGEASAVLVKAVNICLECIGLG